MPHSEDFAAAAAKSGSKFTKIDSAVLCCKTTAALDMYHYYDFINRTLLVRVEQKEHINIVHFRDIEPEVLGFMHARLVELGGNPPPLPVSDAKRPLITKGP